MTAAPAICPNCGHELSRPTDGLAKPVAGLTRRQAQLLRFIRYYMVMFDGEAPSYSDVMNELDISSTSGVHRLVTGLEARGYLTKLPRKARSLSLTPAGEQFARAAA